MGSKINKITIGEIRKIPENYPEITDELADISKIISENFNHFKNKLDSIFKSSFNKNDKVNPWFIDNDWYLSDYWTKDLMKTHPFFSNTTEKYDEFIVKEFDKKIKRIKKTIIDKNPKRENVLMELFKLYEKEYYFGVISLGYSLSDGISREKYGISFFGGYDKTDKKVNTQRIQSKINPENEFSFDTIRLNFRGQMNSVSNSIPEKLVYKSNNRHHVLHGNSYEYGTKINAVKSILLIEYITNLPKITK